MLQIDASFGEGGGQLVRSAVALAAITGKPIALSRIRARRTPSGLAPQHMAAVRAAATLCNARVEGVELRSTALEFVPGALTGGSHRFDVGTAGSICLVLQALLPIMIAAQAEATVTVTGGTDVRAAPPVDYLQFVLLPVLRRMGARIRLDVLRRGYYPRGGGIVRAQVLPCRLQPVALGRRGALAAIKGCAHVANLPEHIAIRMRDAAASVLGERRNPAIDCAVLKDDQATGRGGAVVLWAECEDAALGAGRVAELGVPAEALGESAAKELLFDLETNVTADVHAADQLLIYFALAGGGSLLTREYSSHAATAAWLLEQFLPVRFEVSKLGALTRVAVSTLS